MKKIFKGLGIGFLALALSVGVGSGSAIAATTYAVNAITESGALTINGAAASALTLGSAATTGEIIVGSTSHTGSTTINSGTITGTTSTSGVVFSTDAVTTGTGLFVTADALTTGEGLLIDHDTTVIADGGSLLRLDSSTADTGGATNGTLLDIQSSAQLAGVIVRQDNILTTGSALSIIGTGIMTGAGNLATFTANSATTAAGLVRINGNGLTSGIGEVITSSATAITGAGRLLRVDHTGATGTSAILSEFASAANDETTILRVTASDVLAAGVGLDISAAAMTTGTALDIGGMAAITTGNGIVVAASSTTRTDGMLVSVSDASTAATSTGRMLNVSHTGVTGTSTIVAEIKSAAGDETEILQVLASGALAAGKVVDLTASSLTTGNVLDITYTGTTGSAIKVIDSTGADANAMVWLENTTADVTGQTYLIQGRYTDTADADADFLLFEDANGTDVFSVTESGSLMYRELTESPVADPALTAAESGKTIYLAGTGHTVTLPAVANGLVFRFVISGAFGTDYVITPAAVDLIAGSLNVNGANVDCDVGDTLTFEDGVEDIGDFVELRSNGTLWFIGGSQGQAASSITCQAA